MIIVMLESRHSLYNFVYSVYLAEIQFFSRISVRDRAAVRVRLLLNLFINERAASMKQLLGLVFVSLLLFPSPTLTANGLRVNQNRDWQLGASSKIDRQGHSLITELSTDEEFIEDFNKTARTVTNDPNIIRMLISDFNQRPELQISHAQNLCRAKRGGYLEKIKAQNAYEIFHAANPVIRELLTLNEATDEALAPKYYCPEFNAI